VLLSGGLDSAACAHHLSSQNMNVEGLFVDFGQPSREAEAHAVSALAACLGIRVRTLVMQGLNGFGPGELIGRNAFLISAALFSDGARPRIIALGIHAGTPYYDCSDAFLRSMKRLAEEETDGQVSVVAPFINWQKSAVFEYFCSAGLPVDQTYSCEAGTQPPCGECASCRDRRQLGC
jgi:7-cyano-7-deazaguanine synthase